MPFSQTQPSAVQAIVGEPEVVEDTAAWLRLKDAAIALQGIQVKDGSIPEASDHAAARAHVESDRRVDPGARTAFPHDAEYLAARQSRDFRRWDAAGFGIPDFLDSLVAFQPQRHRVDGIRHLVVFPMYTQNGSANRFVEALIVEVIWPEFIAELENEYTQQAVRVAAARRLHSRVRHELGRALPRDGRDARDPAVHVGRDLPGP